MSFKLVDSGWEVVMRQAMALDSSDICLVSPFIKRKAIQKLLDGAVFDQLCVITRFSLTDFAQGVSDLSALALLLECGALVRGVKHLHAKMYLFGARRAVVTSANLTQAALVRNHELGFVAEDPGIIERCRTYFNDLWGRAGDDLELDRLATGEQRITRHLALQGGSSDSAGLGDEGTDAGFFPDPIVLPGPVAENEQAFVKFFGESHRRADRSMNVLEEVRRSGCHWACTYPKGKRPRQVRDGAVMFMGRMVKEPADILIYGRAVGLRHLDGRDDATPDDIKLREWKAKWPHYIRVHHPEFLAGTLENGLSLNDMMLRFGSDAFVPTRRNARRRTGNTDPRKAYRQQAAVALTPEAAAWLNEQLQAAFDRCGTLPAVELATLDQPAIAALDTEIPGR